jgi:hypothetical protein
MQKSGCKDQGIGLGHSVVRQAPRNGVEMMCVQVRDGAGKHILLKLKGDLETKWEWEERVRIR